jgi:DNA repair photolyase
MVAVTSTARRASSSLLSTGARAVVAPLERVFYPGRVQTFSDLRGERRPAADPALFEASAVVRTFDAPEFRGITFYEVEAKSILNRVPAASRMPFEWTINVYRGCSHACLYCYARPSHTYLNFDAGRDFETKVVVKVNAGEVLRRELRRPSWPGAHVAMGTNTDPYQRCEGRYGLTRAVLEALRDYRNPCSVLTKSPLLLRDLDLFVELAGTAGFSANLSIGTLDEDVWRRSEPGTPHPKARMAAVRALRQAGIPCGILMAPILPGISDSPEQLRTVVRAAAEAGATHLTPLTLHLRPGVKEEFMPWLAREYPELVDGYRRLYRGSNAPKATREAIADRVRAAKRRHPPPSAPQVDAVAARRQREPAAAPPGEPPDQLSLLD